MLCPFDLLKSTNSIDMVKEMLYEMVIIKSQGQPIYPVGDKKSLDDCFTKDEKGNLVLWYNDSQNNTHIVKQGMDIDKLFEEVKDKCPECDLDKFYCNCNNPNN